MMSLMKRIKKLQRMGAGEEKNARMKIKRFSSYLITPNIYSKNTTLTQKAISSIEREALEE